MTRILALACAALIAAEAQARSTQSTETRTPRPVPIQADVKLPAEPVVATPAPTRPATISAARTQAAAQPFARERRTSAVDLARFERLWFDAGEDGATWVRGRTYKARFGPGGATYIPFFGSSAPRNFPVELSLATASVGGVSIDLAPAECAVRDGDRVVIDRGPIDEVYELALDHVEQTFVVAERPAAGDLELFVSLSSELARAETQDGVELSNELGSVRYGRAFVREAGGRKVPVASRLVVGGVEIRIEASYLETAQFPLVVDPIVSTFPVDNNFFVDHYDADTSYDEFSDRYLIVYEEAFSATDHDIFGQARDGQTGMHVGSSYLDVTSEDWVGPQCGNLNWGNQFLVAAQVRNVTGSSGSVIRGRTIDAIDFAVAARFNISTAEMSGDKILADVAGDPYTGWDSSYYCVVWQRNFSPTDTDIHAQLVRRDSTLRGTTILLDNSAGSLDSWPSISKTDGRLSSLSAWTIAWHRQVSSTNYDVRFARLYWDGTIATPTTPLVSSTAIEYYPRVSSPLADGRVLVTWAVNEGTDHDIHYALMSGETVEDTGNLSALDALPTLSHDQIEYSVAADDARFVVTHVENDAAAGDYRPWISAFAPHDGTLVCVEVQHLLDTRVTMRTDVVSTWSCGGAARRFFATWDWLDVVNGGRDIKGAFYDRPLGGGLTLFCPGDGSSAACPCSNNGVAPRGCANSAHSNGALLSGGNNALTGSGDTLSVSVTDVPANVACTLFQGTTANGPSAFGDGLRCVGGTQVRILTQTSNAFFAATWPPSGGTPISVAGAIPLEGALRYYQVSYRNSASFCTPATFNISNGVQVLWLP